MTDKVVDLPQRTPREVPMPVTDFWFAQIETRLTRIEFIVKRLEWQLWLFVCGGLGLLVIDIIHVFAPSAR